MAVAFEELKKVCVSEKTEYGGRKTPFGFYSRKIIINLWFIFQNVPPPTTWRSYFKNIR